MLKILIVDDQPIWLTIIRSILKCEGELDYAEDGVDAIDKFMIAHQQGKLYDLILLDIMMPKMNGIDALKAIRKYEKDLNMKPCVIIMVSAVENSKKILESFKNEANGYIIKCDAKEKLSNNLEKILVKHQLS